LKFSFFWSSHRRWQSKATIGGDFIGKCHGNATKAAPQTHTLYSRETHDIQKADQVYGNLGGWGHVDVEELPPIVCCWGCECGCGGVDVDVAVADVAEAFH